VRRETTRKRKKQSTESMRRESLQIEENVHKSTPRKYLGREPLLDELGEKLLGLDRGDVVPVVTPNQHATFDVQEDQC
jgi:hypothetical protein